MRPIKFRAKDWYGRWCYGIPVLPMKYDGPKCLFAYDFVEGSQYKKWDKKPGETTVLKSTVGYQSDICYWMEIPKLPKKGGTE